MRTAGTRISVRPEGIRLEFPG
ncbi:MAG: hypothetical protein RIQ93_2846, partial [Verrucomicrobiota bacterium]